MSMNNRYEKFNINDCYEDYKSNSNHFSLSIKDYKKIIKAYLTIYTYELFFLNFPMYFFFGGKIIKNNIPSKVVFSNLKKENNKLISLNSSVGFFWFDRPLQKMDEFDFKKIRGSTGSLQKIQKEWLNENDPSSLPTVQQFKNNGYKFLK